MVQENGVDYDEPAGGAVFSRVKESPTGSADWPVKWLIRYILAYLSFLLAHHRRAPGQQLLPPGLP